MNTISSKTAKLTLVVMAASLLSVGSGCTALASARAQISQVRTAVPEANACRPYGGPALPASVTLVGLDDPSMKAALLASAPRGALAASYDGCRFQIVRDCHGTIPYVEAKVGVTRYQGASTDDQAALGAGLPGASGGVRAEDRAASTSAMTIDRVWSLDMPTQLEGPGCRFATHIIRVIEVGSVSFAKVSHSGAGAYAGGYGADAHVAASGGDSMVAGESGPLRIELAPVPVGPRQMWPIAFNAGATAGR